MAQSPDALRGAFRTVDNGDTLIEAQWYQANTIYQILEVRPPIKEEKREDKKIVIAIVAKTRGNGDGNIEPNSFDEYSLDKETIDKLQDYPRKGNGENISSYLPSSGVIFSEGFFKALSNPKTEKIEQTEVNNFYQPMRSILYSRKISQLIAKTWWSYLEAKKKGLWNKFIAGEWDDIVKSKDVDGLYILDGLIAREIFLFGGGASPNEIEGNNDITPPREGSVEQARFAILPTSKSWQGVSLSLLLAGQAYYKIGEKYHQVSQPILSTGQIVSQYSHEVDWSRFYGDIKEIIISQEKPWVAYEVVLPYPPIPDEAEPESIRKWADAEDDEGELPFYNKTEEGDYLIDVKYFRPPYPYIPLSCT